VRPVDKRHRIDLTDVPLVTIDGEDARDFDDAVYCEPLKKGRGKSAFEGWRLIVAIADVSHYVKPGDPVDDDAYERATSVYFPRRVIPMLPEKLSNGLCSLNPDEERLSMVCDMLVSATGEITAYQFYPAVIRSHARLTYTEVAAVLANTRGAEAQRRADLVPHLIHLHEVYRALLKQRAGRGAIDFESTETQIVCDDNGRIEKIVPRTRTEAHKLIEESMLAANVCAAEFIESHKHPALFRVHEGPTPEKRVTLQNYLRALGIGVSLSDDPKPAEIQAIAQATKDRVDAAQISSMLLRSMQQAIYTHSNAGHFGLAYEAYAHFTSPIRRYPDLLVHRVIKAHAAGQAKLSAAGAAHARSRRTASLGAAAKTVPARCSKPAGRPPAAEDAAPGRRPALHCSANERRADEASRDVEAWLKCKYMREHLGEEYGGVVTSPPPASASSSRSTSCTWKGWCTSPNSAASTSASTRRGRNCVASAAACATPSAPGCGCRSAGWTWTGGASISGLSVMKMCREPRATPARRPVLRHPVERGPLLQASADHPWTSRTLVAAAWAAVVARRVPSLPQTRLRRANRGRSPPKRVARPPKPRGVPRGGPDLLSNI
jgi:ribonuclease R